MVSTLECMISGANREAEWDLFLLSLTREQLVAFRADELLAHDLFVEGLVSLHSVMLVITNGDYAINPFNRGS